MIRQLISVIGLSQTAVQLRASLERNRKYQDALAIASLSMKPMLVVGGPAATPVRNLAVALLQIPHHGCGDVCLDINADSCRVCGQEVETTIADVRDIPYPEGYFSCAYCAHVLEHLPSVYDAEMAVKELYRVADEVIIVSPGKADLIAWALPGHHLWVKQTEDGVYLQQR